MKKYLFIVLLVGVWSCEKENSHYVNIEIVPPNGGILEGISEGSHEDGKQFVIQAIPAEGFFFHLWGGDISGNSNPRELKIDSDKDIIVLFSEGSYPANMLEDYSDINKNTSWYITNANFNYFNVKYTNYKGLTKGVTIKPVNYCNGCDFWFAEIGGYIYSDFDKDGTKELWHNYLKDPWPSNHKGIFLYSDEVENIISAEENSSNYDDYSAVFGLTQVRKQVLSDLDNDGKNEIILFSSGLDAPPYPGDSLAIFYPQSQTYLYLSEDIGYFHGGAAGDIDKNGFSDIVAYSGGSQIIPMHPAAYLNNGNNSFELDNTIFYNFEGQNFYEIELFDIDGDDNLDLFLSGNYELYVSLGDGSGTFDFNNKINLSEFVDDNLLALDINFFDFNLDGRKDILILNTIEYLGHSIKVLLQTENKYLYTEATDSYIEGSIAMGNNFWAKWLYLKDVDQDGDIDLMIDGLFGNLSNHGEDILFWENINGKFFRTQISGSVTF